MQKCTVAPKLKKTKQIYKGKGRLLRKSTEFIIVRKNLATVVKLLHLQTMN